MTKPDSGVRMMPDSYPIASGVRYRRLAMDAALEPGGMKRLLALLAKNLSSEELADILPHLARLRGGEPDAEDESEEDLEPLARATPPNGIRAKAPDPFPGRPRPGGAMDSASTKSFAERFPDAARIKTGPSYSPGFGFTTAKTSSASFRKRYRDAA
jgi:hypothetical protein